MAEVTQSTIDGIAYREALPAGDPTARPTCLFLHGYPSSSYLWRAVLPAVADRGLRAVAPDLPGFGDSPADLPGTWEHQVENVERFRAALRLDQVILGVHDWGGLIGLRWACENPQRIAGLVITDTGFFSDGRWHGMAKSLQTPGDGELFLDNINRDLFAAGTHQVCPTMPDDAIDEYWKAFGDADRRTSQLDLYRSGDFAKIAPYEPILEQFDVPTKIVWGARDEFAPVGGAYRFEKRIPGAELTIIDSAGHFLMEDEPQRVADEIAGFVAGI